MLKANEFELKLAATQLQTRSFKFINAKIYALSVSNAHSIFARISYINFFVRNVLAQFLRGVSASYRKGKLRMHNFNEEHPQVIENVGCRCKIFKGSILRSQKSKSIIAPPYFDHGTPQSKTKTMQSSELESGLPDEAEQECIVFFLLGIVVN